MYKRQTPDGNGVVTETVPLRECVKVRITLPDKTLDIREYPLSEVSWPGKPAAPSPAP